MVRSGLTTVLESGEINVIMSYRDPTKSHVIFDLEATSTNPDTAEIVQIAALHPEKGSFVQFVESAKEIEEDADVWSITKIDFASYQTLKKPPEDVYSSFLNFIGDAPLAGHNILSYDLPLLERSLKEVGLRLPPTHKPSIDTLHWAKLRYPTPPEDLKSYRLSDLYEFASGEILNEAHQADKDCEANLKVLRHLYEDPPDPGTLKVWEWLGLLEASWYDVSAPDIDELEELLKVPAHVPWIDKPGRPFPSLRKFAPAWLDGLTPEEFSAVAAGNLSTREGSRVEQGVARRFLSVTGGFRPSQFKMMREVSANLEESGGLMVEAPTGTGKTRGYLYPAFPHVSESSDARVMIATHTKVLQQQVYDELDRVASQGYGTQAVTVKSARDYICLDALSDALKDDEDADEGEAVGVLVGYIRQHHFDLEALPKHWDFQPTFREAKFNVRTNPNRCRASCPFFNHCAYQADLRHRSESSFWVTNQAWLLHHYAGEAEESDEQSSERVHLVIDEAHNLENVATEAFSKVTSQEDTLFHLHRIYDERRRKGWLRDNSNVDEAHRSLASDVRTKLIPNALGKLGRYSERITEFLKQYGEGDLQYGLSLSLGPKIRGRREWPKLRLAEDEWLKVARTLRGALGQFPGNSWLGRNLRPTIDFLKQQVDLIYERRSVVREEDHLGDSAQNYIHLTRFDAGSGWEHVAQPVDVANQLQHVWEKAESVTLTSATLSLNGDFTYFKRVLGLDEARTHCLPETLPYDKAHLIVPSHLPEARTSNMFRFQPLYHRELSKILPKSHRSLSLFTSTARMQEAGRFLEKLPQLYIPLTRREREDIAQVMRTGVETAAALGTRSYMEGVDFPNLKVVNLERIPFPVPTPLLKARQELAQRKGLDPWQDVYLPRALFAFVQAFGRLIRDNRVGAGEGAFILWDKRLLNASYQLMLLNTLPRGVNIREPQTRSDFYQALAGVLELNPENLPQEELLDTELELIKELRDSDESSRVKVEKMAEKFWRIDDIKPRQWEAINATFNQQDILVLLPTGYGKSLTFQIPAILLDGVTLVVSPLIALMQDQVSSLQKSGLPAAALHSLLTGAEQRSILDEVRSGRINLLYVSPERINRSEELKNLLRDLGGQGKLTRLVLDEAHCLSEWGHDFRPDYLSVAAVLRDFAPGIPISALTATATPKVQNDLITHLRLNEPVAVTDTYDRPNLSYFVYQKNDIQKLQRLTQVINFVETRHSGHSVIVYASTRKQVERVAWALCKLGFKAEAYHAGLSKIVRNEVQEQFEDGDINVLVATNAFGMGVDLPSVRAVVHFNPPFNLPAYIQEAGRAGRDGLPAFSVLLHCPDDWRLANWLLKRGGPDTDHATTLMEALTEECDGVWSGYADELVDFINARLLEEQFDLERDRLGSLLIALQEAKCIDYSYRVGRTFVLCESPEKLKPHLNKLRELGFQGKLEGDELDFGTLPLKEADELNQFLYNLHQKRLIRLYTNREPALELRASAINPYKAFNAFRKRQNQLQHGKLNRLKEIQCYAEVGDPSPEIRAIANWSFPPLD